MNAGKESDSRQRKLQFCQEERVHRSWRDSLPERSRQRKEFEAWINQQREFIGQGTKREALKKERV